MSTRRRPRQLHYDKTRVLKINSFYDNQIVEEAACKNTTVSKVLRRIIQAHVHAQLAIRKKREEQQEEKE